MNTPEISVVFPAWNEEASLPELFARARAALARCEVSFELILVDDGSTDGTFALARREAEQHADLRVIRLARNFGHQAALLAGLRAARGRAVISLDADLQHPPEVIEELITAWREGHDVVHTLRIDSRRSAGFFKRWLSLAFYAVFRRLTGLALKPGMADYRLVSRHALSSALASEEVEPFLRGRLVAVGFRQAFVEYRAAPRVAGRSGYTWRRMAAFALHAIVGYSELPLYWSFAMGLLTGMGAGCYGLYVVYIRLFTDHAVPGWASLAVLLSFFVALQFFFLGLIGTYVAAVYREVKRRPSFVIAETFPERREV